MSGTIPPNTSSDCSLTSNWSSKLSQYHMLNRCRNSRPRTPQRPCVLQRRRNVIALMPLPQQLALETPQRLDRYGLPLPQQSAPRTPRRRTRQDAQKLPSRTLSTIHQDVHDKLRARRGKDLFRNRAGLQHCRNLRSRTGPSSKHHLWNRAEELLHLCCVPI